MEQLKIIYGKDQQAAIDKLLAEMKDEGKVLKVEKEQTMMVGNELADMVRYTITFDMSYSIYLFGHRSGNLLRYMHGE
jgi:hypothetical protein